MSQLSIAARQAIPKLSDSEVSGSQALSTAGASRPQPLGLCWGLELSEEVAEPPHVAWASSQHGDWVPKAPRRERHREEESVPFL